MFYDAVLHDLTSENYTKYFAEAERYNRELSQIDFPLMNYEKATEYEDILNVGGNGS